MKTSLRTLGHMVLLALLASVSSVAAQTTAEAPKAQLELPSFGLSIPLPIGYTRLLERSLWEVCVIHVPDATGKPQHLISIQIAKLPPGQTNEQVARSMAGPKGTITKAKWGNLEALDVRVDPATAKDNWYAARHLLADSEGFGFMMSYATAPGREDFKAFDEIAGQTAWLARSIANVVRSRGQTVPIGPGLGIDLPDPFRRDKDVVRPGMELFVVTDFKTEKPSLKLIHSMSRSPAGATLEQVLSNFPIKPTNPIQWTQAPGGKAAISGVFTDADQQYQAITLLGPENVLHTFVFNLPPGSDAKQMNLAAEILANSLTMAK